jgi:hypothetical protein
MQKLKKNLTNVLNVEHQQKIYGGKLMSTKGNFGGLSYRDSWNDKNNNGRFDYEDTVRVFFSSIMKPEENNGETAIDIEEAISRGVTVEFED